MIGKIIVGTSLRKCLNYCLGKEQAEVLEHNLCSGETKEIWTQMKEVREQNMNVSREVQHMTISFAKEDQVNRAMLLQVADECAKEMGFQNHQYVVVEHHDTEHKHIHIIVNRVGMDGRTLSDSSNYKKMAEFCRRMEEKFKLKQVLSPRKFQKQEHRHLPRNDERKEKLKSTITDCLWKANGYEEFARLMKLKGYRIDKARGIAFEDAKKVRIKGSEVGYPLQKIEKILATKSQKQTLKQEQKLSQLLSPKPSSGLLPKKNKHEEDILDILTEKQKFEENVNHKYKKKKQRQRHL